MKMLLRSNSTVFILPFDTCTLYLLSTFNLLMSKEGLTHEGTKVCPMFPSMSFSVYDEGSWFTCIDFKGDPFFHTSAFINEDYLVD